MKTTVRFDELMTLRISVVCGKESMAEFVRRATEERLLREEARVRAKFDKMDWTASSEPVEATDTGDQHTGPGEG